MVQNMCGLEFALEFPMRTGQTFPLRSEMPKGFSLLIVMPSKRSLDCRESKISYWIFRSSFEPMASDSPRKPINFLARSCDSPEHWDWASH